MDLFGSTFPLFFSGRNAKRSPTKEAAYRNHIEWMNQFVYLVNTCVNQFEWEGLPDTINTRYLEQVLLFDGRVGIANDPNYGIIALRCTAQNVFNIYGDYSELTLYGNSYNGKTFKAYMEGADNTGAQAVLGRDNDLSYPYYMYLVSAADRLTDSMRNIDVTMFNLCFPFIIGCEETEKKGLEDMLKHVRNKELAVVGSKFFTEDKFKVMQTGVNPSILSVQWDGYKKLENAIRQQLGIQNNPEPDKAERMIVDEVNSNNDVTNISADIRLRSRQKMCDQMNELFGTNVSVKLRYENGGSDDVLGYRNRETEDPDGMEE